MRLYLRVVFFVFALSADAGLLTAQVTADRVAHDFGKVDRDTDRVADFNFTNSGDKEALVLTTETMPEYTSRWSARSVAPGATIVLRVKFNPQRKTRYDDQVTVYFSSMLTPVVLRLTSEVAFIDRSDNPACPDFGTREADCCPDDAFTIEVVDALTQAPIRAARVQVYEQGRRQRDVTTDRLGQYSEAFPIGYYLIHAASPGYRSSDTTSYLNRRNNFIRLELEPIEEPVALVPEPVQTVPPTPSEHTAHEAAEPVATPPAVPAKPAAEERFVPNTIVFLVDVSQSMFYKSRLELLKTAMLEMIEALRPSDRVALISYAETTEEVIGMTESREKKALEGAVGSLAAGGRTAGAKGFRRAYGLLEGHVRAGGNNQLIVVTDGAFRTMDAENIVALAKEYSAHGIVTTIVGVRCSDAGAEKLTDIARACGGNFIAIDDLDAGGARLQTEIAQRSMIGR